MEPTVIYEDEEIIVVDKPSGMIVYPDGRHDYPALSAWLEKKYGEVFFAHRIDRETSGVLVVAKNEHTREELQKQFKNHEVKKVYRAFVYGTLKQERGIIERAIGSARGGSAPRSSREPYGKLREATTVYRSIRSGGGVTYVEAFPKTGRTHQIRVHFSSIGHPIVCDTLYTPKREPMLGFARLALHALSITFNRPGGGEKTFEAPLPLDFAEAEKLC
jgi:23S rRNA pseudouridine1911/1915/1917 synthase